MYAFKNEVYTNKIKQRDIGDITVDIVRHSLLKFEGAKYGTD